MKNTASGKERREFLRFSYNESIRYSIIKECREKDFSSDLMNAISKNLSASGILFVTSIGNEPGISRLLVLDLDFKTTNICREIEERALILGDNKLIGKVVRIEDNEDGTCSVGVAFVKKTDALQSDIGDLETLAKRF